MTTLTMKDPHAIGNPYLRMDFTPSLPRFMETAGLCAILVRHHGEPEWSEQWVETSGFVTEHIDANTIEVERYQYNHDADALMFIDDLPEPIACHDADLWDDVTDDLDDYEKLALQYENAHTLVA